MSAIILKSRTQAATNLKNLRNRDFSDKVLFDQTTIPEQPIPRCVLIIATKIFFDRFD